jgi:hypothetical protein
MDETIATLYRRESRRVFSTLVRLLGSLDAAEEALHDAFVAAAEQWPTQGVPANPVAWLVSAGRFKAIDRMRRDKRLVGWDEAAEQAEAVAMRDGPEAGLALIEALLPGLPGYPVAPAAAADLCRRAGRVHEAQLHYRAAITLARQEPERRLPMPLAPAFWSKTSPGSAERDRLAVDGPAHAVAVGQHAEGARCEVPVPGLPRRRALERVQRPGLCRLRAAPEAVLAPSPLWGEGEGPRRARWCFSGPHPHPLPEGEGANPKGSMSVRSARAGPRARSARCRA